MSLANLLPPLSKSWADEVNDEFDEIFLDQSSYNYVLHTPRRVAYDSDDEDNTMIPPDFIEYEVSLPLNSSSCNFIDLLPGTRVIGTGIRT